MTVSSPPLVASLRGATLVIPKNTDVRMVALSNTNDTTVSGRIAGILSLVVG